MMRQATPRTYLKTLGSSGWAELGGSAEGGGISNTPGASTLPSVAVTPTGEPVVAWLEDLGGNTEVYLKTFDAENMAWLELDGSAEGGGISRTDAPSYDPRLAIGGDRACVSWTDSARDDLEIFLRCHDAWW